MKEEVKYQGRAATRQDVEFIKRLISENPGESRPRGRPIACFAWSSAPRHIACRDNYIGWTSEVRKNNIHLIACNSRYLILPWVRSSCLASHLLGRIARVLPVDWERVYNHPIYFFETFVDTERFKGACYKAANRVYPGKTTGRGKNDQTHKPNRSIKAVWGYPLSKDFRRLLYNG
ncbi:MAG TPA: DUF4338 domain-containing protein [Nitrospirae bacterium]|nr:DUF4338 domain-containing protein [Nitrospirota bacterium]